MAPDDERRRAPPRQASEPLGERIERVHLQIQQLLGQLAAEHNLGRMQRLLADLAALLGPHFADEEAPSGLYDTLQSIRPAANNSRLKSLREDHRRILSELDDLRRQLAELRRAASRLQSAKAVLVERVRNHERDEIRLMQDTYMLDEGGPD